MITRIRTEAELAQFNQKAYRGVIKASASWCGPCRRIAPAYEHLSSAYPALWFAEFDVDTLPAVTDRLNTTTIPTFYFFQQGRVVRQLKGSSVADLQKAVAEFAQ